MRYFVTIDGREHEVELAPDGVRVDGVAMAVDMEAVPGTPIRHLLVDGRSHRLTAEPDGDGRWKLHQDGRTLIAEVVDERTRAIHEMTGGGPGKSATRPLRAPMPGMIVRVEVAPGDRVAEGQGLVIIEAMKMENELRSPATARIASIRVEAGQAVEKNQVLVEFETTAGEAA